MNDAILLPAVGLPLIFWIISMADGLTSDRVVKKGVFLTNMLAGVAFFFACQWATEYANTPWKYKVDEQLTVQIDKDGYAKVVTENRKFNLNKIAGKNYKEGDSVHLKVTHEGPYRGLTASEKVFVE